MWLAGWLAGWCWHGMAGRAAVVPRPAPRARAGHRPDRRRAGCVAAPPPACAAAQIWRPTAGWPASAVPVPVPVLLLVTIAHRGHTRTHAPPIIAAIFERVWSPSSLARAGGAAASQRRWVDSGDRAAASSSPSSSPAALSSPTSPSSSPAATMLTDRPATTDADDRSSLAAWVAGAYRRRRRRLQRWLAGCPSCFWNRFQSKSIGKSQSILGAFGIDWKLRRWAQHAWGGRWGCESSGIDSQPSGRCCSSCSPYSDIAPALRRGRQPGGGVGQGCAGADAVAACQDVMSGAINTMCRQQAGGPARETAQSHRFVCTCRL
jgi:hypothetical protein